MRWQQDAPGGNSAGGGGGGGGGDGLRMGRIQRQKVRLDRKRLVESMVKVMELYGTSQSLLEIEYFDEVGTGLGPTLEFYSNVCRELRRKGGIQFNNAEDLVKLWQEDSTRSISLAVTDASGAQKNVGTSSKEKEAKEDVSMSEADEEDVDAVEKRKKKADATADVAGATAEYIYSPLGLFPSPINKASKHSTSTK